MDLRTPVRTETPLLLAPRHDSVELIDIFYSPNLARLLCEHEV